MKKYVNKMDTIVKCSLGMFIVFVAVFSVVMAIDQYFPIEEYVEQNVLSVQGTTIIIGRDCKAIVADTSAERADSIKLGLEKEIFVRPNTHDIFSQTLKTFNISLARVSFDGYDGEVYYASMILRTPEKELKLDTKPSDAIAVALRMDAQILIKKTFLDEFGENICLEAS